MRGLMAIPTISSRVREGVCSSDELSRLDRVDPTRVDSVESTRVDSSTVVDSWPTRGPILRSGSAFG